MSNTVKARFAIVVEPNGAWNIAGQSGADDQQMEDGQPSLSPTHGRNVGFRSGYTPPASLRFFDRAVAEQRNQ